MKLYLNREQSKGLANFLFDVGKGTLLGSIGMVTIIGAKIVIVSFGLMFAAACVFQALFLLGKIN
jgi:hypothetical protein